MKIRTNVRTVKLAHAHLGMDFGILRSRDVFPEAGEGGRKRKLRLWEKAGRRAPICTPQ